ncbi:MAG: hypothetical protein AB8I08_39145 [Sandaracinaceae bacterium]
MRNDDAVEELIAEGLRLFGRGQEGEAVVCWRRALVIDPTHPQALDYLESTGVDGHAASLATELDAQRSIREERITGVVDKQAVLQAVKRREFDHALRMLYEARREHPNDASISRSIQHIKARLERELIAQLVDLDRVPKKSQIDVPTGNLEAEIVSHLIDGIASLGDVVETSPLGRLRTLRVLVGMLSGSMVRPVEYAPPPGPTYRERFRAATLLYLKGEHQAAMEAFEACAELRPDDATVRHNLERLRARAGDV